MAGERTFVALPIALLAALTFAAERAAPLRRHPAATALVEAAFTGAAAALSGGARSPMLPYLLAPAFAIGLVGSWRQVTLVSAGSVAGLAAGRLAYELGAQPVPDGDLAIFALTGAQWVTLGLALGLIAGWAQRLVAQAPEPASERYTEARQLLEQLRGVTRRLPGGLDLASSADALLESCTDVTPSQRSAVLVQPAPGQLVPAAIRGTQRVPWRAPLSEPGPLRSAWETGLPVVDRRRADVHGRRRGSCLAVLPLITSGGPFGLLILESYDEEAFDEDVLQQLQHCADEGSLRLETAMLFDEVRSTVTVEERGRLARDMHDGVAQELAFVGYQLDDLRLQATKVDEALAESLTDVRHGLTRLISDIRLSITDLRTSVSNDRGLGAALTSYVRAVASGQRLAVHMSLEESAFRLPGEQEVLLFQVAQAVAQDARRSGQAANLWVRLEVDPPSARLLVEHDGRDVDLGALDLADYTEHLSRFGGRLRSSTRADAGISVEVVLEGGTDGDQGPAGR